jgi:hypothetical protein
VEILQLLVSGIAQGAFGRLHQLCLDLQGDRDCQLCTGRHHDVEVFLAFIILTVFGVPFWRQSFL